MTERLINHFESADKKYSVKVYYESGNREYICKLFVAGKHRTQADYFTDDKNDALMTAANMLQRAEIKKPRKAPTVRKNPAPRIGTARPRRVSQVTKAPPTKRLVKRRKQNTDVGYFPNPIKSARTEIVEEIRARVNHIASEKDIIRKQALVSYTEGVIHAANVCGVLTFNEALKYRALLKKYAA